MQKYTETVAAWLVKCQVIEEQEKELYCYAMESYILPESVNLVSK